MNHEEVLAVLPDSKEEAKSIKEIAQAMGLEVSSYVDWVRAELRLVRALGVLIKWGWVAYEERQKKKVTSSGIMLTGRRSWRSKSTKKVLALALFPKQELSRPLLRILIVICFTANLFISILDHLLHIRDPDTEYLSQDLFSGLKFQNP